MQRCIKGFWAILLLTFSVGVNAQIISDFGMFELSGAPAGEGCVTYIVTFRDSSTLNGANVPYQSVANGDAYNSHTWSFGTGAANSFLQNPTFAYATAGTFTVSLIVFNGTNRDTSTAQVIVHAKPVIDFAADFTSGCDSLVVCFTDQSTSGSLSMADWTWDFGDGNITTLQNPCHMFTLNQNTGQNCFNITLIGINTQGCDNSLTRNSFICIDPPPVADFSASPLAICDSPFVIDFTDLSTSLNPLAYTWNFGDGSPISTVQNPTHTYANAGNYTVTLIVRDLTCNKRDTIIRTNYIRTRDVAVNFTMNNTTICEGNSVAFTNTTTGAGINPQYTWDFGDNTPTSNQVSPSHTYSAAGTYTVTLTLNHNVGCVKDTSYTVVVLPSPTVDFSAVNTSSCQAPITVDFTELASPDVITFAWNFAGSGTSNLPNPSHTFTSPGNYNVRLTVTNSQGCTATILKPNFVNIDPTVIAFTMDSAQGCVPLTVNFTNTSTSNDPIISYSWDLDDNGVTANTLNTSHTYTTVGTYNPSLTIQTQGGCIGTISQTVTVGNPPQAAFTANPLQVCSGEPIILTNQSTGIISNYQWDFGGNGTSTLQNPPPLVIETPGNYTITLTVSSNGCADATTQVVTVLNPFADFTYNIDCSTPFTADFTNTSTGGHLYSWSFGDGNVSSLENPSHPYLAAGNYSVTLEVTDTMTNCTTESITSVRIVNKTVNFVASDTVACAPATIVFTNISTGGGLTHSWNFGDGTTSGVRSPTKTYQNPGVYTVRLQVRDVNGCIAIEEKVGYIRVYDITGDFQADVTFGCLPPTGNGPTVNFTDLSTTTAGTSLSSWDWDFGDGNTDTGPAVSNQYNTAGLFNVTLEVTNDVGCSDTVTKPNYIDINQPRADFISPFNLYCSGQSVLFTNRSQGDNLTYFWNFGDPSTLGDTAITRNTSYPYVDTGSYDVSLVVTDRYGCQDSIVRNNYINIQNPSINFVADDTFRFCPPHLVNFNSLIFFDTIAVRNIFWNFGDNSFSNVVSPSHIYNTSGSFTVTLEVEFVNGCRDSITLPNYINVGGATGNIIVSDPIGCVAHTACFNANSQNAASIVWIYGDGNTDPGGDSICHEYEAPGIYAVSVVLSDTQAPTCSYVLTASDSIIVDSVIVDFSHNLDTVCAFTPIDFTDESSAFFDSSFVAWFWDFGDGSTDTVQNPTYAFPNTGVQNVTLTATNSTGCSSSITKTLYVLDKPTAAFSVSDTVGCDTLEVNVVDMSTDGMDGTIIDWFWDFGDPTNPNDTFRTQNPPPYVYVDTGLYWISLLVTDDNGCTDADTIWLSVYPVPGGISGQDTFAICEGDTITISGEPGYMAYDWTPGTSLSDSTVVAPLAFPQDTITYTLLTTDFTGCTSFDYVHINVNPAPTVVVSPYPDTVICLGESVQLDVQSDNGISYSWAPISGLNNPNIANPLATPTQTTTYIVTVTDPNSCTNQDTVTIFVNLFTVQFDGPDACLGDPTNFVDQTTTSNFPVTDWAWDFGDNSGTSILQNPSYTYADSGNYQVQLVVMDQYGCTDSATQTVRVDIPPTPFAGFDTLICMGESVQLLGGGGDTIFWTPMVDIDDPFSYTPVVTPDVTTRYIANVTNGVCPFDTAGVQVTVIPTPFVQTIDDDRMLRGTQIELVSQVGDVDTFYWSPIDSLDCPVCVSPVANPDVTTTYVLSVVDEFGCTNADTVTVTVYERCDEDLLFVANAFTPNNDGLNDKVYARVYGLKEVNSLRIFDRWGQLMFETTNRNEGWDGTNLDGRKLNSGVYVYIAEAVCYNGNTIRKSGNVTLLK